MPAFSFFWFFLLSDLLSADSFSSLTLPTSAFPSVHNVYMYMCMYECILWGGHTMVLNNANTIHHGKSHKKKRRMLPPFERDSAYSIKKQTWVPAFWKTKGVVRFNMWRSLCLWLFLLTPLSHPKGHPNSSSDTLNTLGTTCHRYHQAFLS